MSDSGFREVQLSGKQVVFLFIATTVAFVGVFLLGVRVGRGAIPPEPMTQATPTPADDATPSVTPGVMPPATAPAPGELKYHETLQGKSNPTAAVPPTPSPTPPASATKPVATPSAPTPTPTVKPAPATKSASATAVWFVQVDSFGTAANADRRIAQLKAKGIAASVVDAGGSGARYKVKVGPMERAAADAMRARLLKEGFKPSPVSR